jgi:hypothetical protein
MIRILHTWRSLGSRYRGASYSSHGGHYSGFHHWLPGGTGDLGLLSTNLTKHGYQRHIILMDDILVEGI